MRLPGRHREHRLDQRSPGGVGIGSHHRPLRPRADRSQSRVVRRSSRVAQRRVQVIDDLRQGSPPQLHPLCVAQCQRRWARGRSLADSPVSRVHVKVQTLRPVAPARAPLLA
jgi:hypothetical protein